jgi:hypothetical protein
MMLAVGLVAESAAGLKWTDPSAIRPETTTKESVAAHAHKKLLHVIPYGHTIGAITLRRCSRRRCL